MEPPPAKRKCGVADQPEPGPLAAAAAVETLLDLSARRVAETWAFEQKSPPPVPFPSRPKLAFQFKRGKNMVLSARQEQGGINGEPDGNWIDPDQPRVPGLVQAKP
uniref:Uncharacterized protein n=1 Tax=Sphaerodactylus townsendi TaxID=933632 RepID=A0ACB8ELY2_9SAUR